MDLIGITVDVPVSDLSGSEAFYTLVLDRRPDRTAVANLVEWILSRDPEIALRLSEGEAVPPHRSRVGLGVTDLERERQRLAELLPGVPDISTRPGVIAELELRDPDGYRVVLWQDLMSGHAAD